MSDIILKNECPEVAVNGLAVRSMLYSLPIGSESGNKYPTVLIVPQVYLIFLQ